jgi:hypothetical protein
MEERMSEAYNRAISALISLDGFIEYLENTREDEWQVDVVRNVGNTKNCMFGHLVNWYYGKDEKGNISPIWEAFEAMWSTAYAVYPVNDGHSPEWTEFKYNQPTPKQRVIAYLKNLNAGKELNTNQVMERDSKRFANH